MEAIDVLRLFKKAKSIEAEAHSLWEKYDQNWSCIKCDHCMEGAIAFYCILGGDYHYEECIYPERVEALRNKDELEAESRRLMELFNKELLLVD